ncbi:MAG TPA: hypothetical protein VES40_05380 [Ilumatobacteraceae bacterium]|nr:hypothetical protein [Ilumatobacteraceae bacterium]
MQPTPISQPVAAGGARISASDSRAAAGSTSGAHRQLAEQCYWIAGGMAVGFLVPFVFADRLGVQRDVYYGIYGVVVISFLTVWMRFTHQNLSEMIHRRLTAAIVLGVVFAGVMAVVVLRTADATSRPGGVALFGAVVWRGVFYGAIDGLLLSAFPILAVFAAFAGTEFRARRSGTLAIGALALVASLMMTGVYHLGYAQFRSSDIRSPLTGDVLWGVPTLLTLNPIGAPIAHIGLHVTAVLHSYDTDLFLPPHPTSSPSDLLGASPR